MTILRSFGADSRIASTGTRIVSSTRFLRHDVMPTKLVGRIGPIGDGDAQSRINERLQADHPVTRAHLDEIRPRTTGSSGGGASTTALLNTVIRSLRTCRRNRTLCSEASSTFFHLGIRRPARCCRSARSRGRRLHRGLASSPVRSRRNADIVRPSFACPRPTPSVTVAVERRVRRSFAGRSVLAILFSCHQLRPKR